MSLKLSIKNAKPFVKAHELDEIYAGVAAAHKVITDKSGAGNDFLGWTDLPVSYDKEEYARIKACAEKIKKNSKVFVVIGIGGSYLGARAAIEFVSSPLYNNIKKDTPDIFFAGNTISTAALRELLDICRSTDFSINVISKSGTTTEPAIAFRFFRMLLEEKYGADGARERIFVTTDKQRGTLKKFADQMGYETFVVPDDIGGRYSVFTAVGLLPIAVSGADTDKMLQGAAAAREAYASPELASNDCYLYAAMRNILYRKGRTVEIMAAYEPSMTMMNEWYKQLFGESEGKDGKGIFPASVVFTTDLHSMGQYIQDGMRNIFETFIEFEKPDGELLIPEDPANVDGLNFIAGKSVDFVNRCASKGTIIAHNDGGVPALTITLGARDEYCFGELVFFFEKACALSGYMLGINPFNQPGVEDYKKNMFALLGKPGYEELALELTKRLAD